MKKRMIAIMACLMAIVLTTSAYAAGDTPTTSVERGKESSGVFKVLDISERTYDNGPAIGVLLSEPMEPTVRHDEHLRISSPKDLLKSAWVLSDDRRTLYFPHVEAETQYSVTVLESLKSASGKTLGKRESKNVTTRKVTPIVSFASTGLLLPAKMSQGLPIVTVNVKAVNIEFFKINENAFTTFINWDRTSGKQENYELMKLKEFGQIVYSGRFDLDAPPNKRVVYHIPIETVEQLQKPGIYLAVMREPGEFSDHYQATYFLVTDIALHARIYANESVVFASSLKAGTPLSGVKLNFYDVNGKPVGEGVTDEEGKYRHPEKLTTKVQLIRASRDNEAGILPLNIPALDMSEFDPGGRSQRIREVFIYSPRNIYRPGEKMTVSGLLRNYDGKSTDALPLKANLYRPDGKEAKTFTWHVQKLDADMGYYQTDIDLPKDAQTGKWLLKVYDNPAIKSPAGVYEFHVEDFLPERMKLDLSSEEPFPGPEDDVVIKILGQYLYGAPASENNFTARIRAKAKREIFPDKLKGFEFGDAKDEKYKDFWEVEEQKLNQQGEGELTITSRWQEIKSPVSVKAVVDLFETGGRPVTRGIEKIVWPAETLIGVRPLFEKSADEGAVKFEVVKMGQDGNMLAASDLIVELTKEDRDYYWEYSDSDGWRYRYSEKNYLFQTDSLKLEAGKPTPYTIQLKSGLYVLSIKDPATNIITSLRFHVGSWYWYGDNQDKAARPDKVLLKPDKPSYRPGDVVKLTVTPPSEGEALIVVEGEKPIWIKRAKVSPKGTVVEIPVGADWDSHDLHISAIVFRPAAAKEKITPNRAIGLVHLPLDRSERKLTVKIDAPDKAVPQNPLIVKLRLDPTPDPSPKRRGETFVTVAAVDVGILNITDFKTPDPFGWFFAPRHFDVNSYDIYAKVIEYMDGRLPNLRFGGDMDTAGGKPPETKIKLLSLFQAPVKFDDKGEASVTFDLPDFNGRIRLMAIAFGKDSFGSAEKEVTVAAPVVAELATPRFMAPGDTAEFTLDVHNLSGADKNIKLKMTANEPLTLEKGEQTVQLKDKQKAILRFPVKATESFGGSKIILKLEGEGIKLTRDWQVGVRPGYPATARKVQKILKEDKSFTLDDRLVADMFSSTVDAAVKISPTIFLDIRNAMHNLLTYPYGCLEQTSSGAYPLLYATPERITQFNLRSITHEERIKRLQAGIDRVATMQLPSGGFGLWNKSGPEMAWLTVYVTDFLLQAREQGLSMSEAMPDNALKRLEYYLKNGPPADSFYGGNKEREHSDFAIRAYAAYVLAKVNRAPLGTLRPLYDNHHKKAGSSLPLAHIAIALKKMGDTKRASEALKLSAAKRCEKYGYWGDYGSLVRDLALTITLMIENKSENVEGFEKMLLDLGNEMRDRKWYSTQEQCAIFRAGIALDLSSDKVWKGKLAVAGKETALEKKGSHVFTPSIQEVKSGVSFFSESEQMLYASAVVSGYTKTPPPKDDSRIALQRKLYDLQGQPIQKTEFKVGEMLLVHVRVLSKEWLPDGLVIDLLPACFEIENQNLKHAMKMEDFQIEGKTISQWKEACPVIHEEYRDDRYAAFLQLSQNYAAHLFYLVRVVSPGTFSVPPTMAESMYRPEIRGIGETSPQIKVLNKSN